MLYIIFTGELFENDPLQLSLKSASFQVASASCTCVIYIFDFEAPWENVCHTYTHATRGDLVAAPDYNFECRT